MKLVIAIGDVGQAPKVEDLVRGKGARCDGDLTGEADCWYKLNAQRERIYISTSAHILYYCSTSPIIIQF
jgi:hypothetical protein